MLTFKAIENFFDRDHVIAAMDETTLKALSKAGAFIRQRARTSMRRRKRPSEPGQPPSVHSGELREYLFFAWDASSRSVVVGPAGFKNSDVPNLQEFGGVRTNQRERTIRVVAPGQGPRGRRTEARTLRAGEPIVYPKRPYMAPALEKELSRVPSLFQNAVRVEA